MRGGSPQNHCSHKCTADADVKVTFLPRDKKMFMGPGLGNKPMKSIWRNAHIAPTRKLFSAGDHLPSHVK